ncbi:MAG: hypothetical protein ACOC1K_01040 [Nanoarchaeota archaeon]
MAKKEAKLEINKEEKVFESNDRREIADALKDALKNNSQNKPSEEEVEEARKEYEKAAAGFDTKLWAIGTSDQAENFANYLLHFIENRIFWTKNGWMGVIKLNQEVNEAKDISNSTNSPLKLGYQALEFTYYSLSNPGGTGLNSAKDMESEWEQYVDLFRAIEEQLEESRKILKDIQFLQDKWGAMAQGFYLDVEPDPGPDQEGDEKSQESPSQPSK